MKGALQLPSMRKEVGLTSAPRTSLVADWRRERREDALRSFCDFLPHWWFVNRETGKPSRFVPETMWQGQRELAALYDAEPWVFALKAGKLGFTQLESAFDAYKALRFSNSRVHIFSMNQQASVDLLAYVKYGLDRLPDWFEVRVRQDLAGGEKTQSLKISIGLGQSDVRTIYSYAGGDNVSIDQTCLNGDSLVETAAGPRRIRHLVRDAYDGEVLTVAADGQLTSRRVIGWHRSLLAGRRMFKLWLKNRPRTKHQPAVNLTEDHLVLTPDGWRATRDLREGDLIATGQTSPNPAQTDLLTGALLGDGHLRSSGLFQAPHVDHEYSQLLASALAGLEVHTLSLPARPGHRTQTVVRSKQRIWGAQLRASWYVDGRKKVNRPAVEEMGDLGLAVWFMDDGWLYPRPNGWRYSAGLVTNGFTFADVAWLSGRLQTQGIANRPKRTTKGQWTIYVTAEGTEALMERIGRFLLPEMNRKRTPSAPPFDPQSWNLGTPVVGFDEIGIRPWTLPAHERTVYCIDVEETHNFVTPGGVLHNCLHAHVDELARMSHPDRTWGSIQSTVAPEEGSCHIVSRGQGESDFLSRDPGGLWPQAALRAGKLVGYFAPWSYRPDRDELWFERESATMTPQQMAWFAPADVDDAFAGDATQIFVPMEWWDSCMDPELRDNPLMPGDMTPLILGMDAAVTGDCFAIVAVSRQPRRLTNAAVRAVKIWKPSAFGGRIDFDYIERWLRVICVGGCEGFVDGRGLLQQHPVTAPDPACDACRDQRMQERFNVVQIAYDPHELESMAQRLRRDMVAWMFEFGQGEERLQSDKNLYDLIGGRRIAHNGDPTLREHIDNSKAKIPKDDDKKLRLIKKSPSRKIDGAVALSMAAQQCLYLNMPGT